MCISHELRCTCGARTASFHFRDNILPVQAVSKLYCPACSEGVALDAGRMVADNGWIIQYDMEIAGAAAAGKLGPAVTPEFLFDEGYCSWNGVYPGDAADSVREREEIIALAKTNPREYLSRITSWANSRMAKLREEGWRKARNEAGAVCGTARETVTK